MDVRTGQFLVGDRRVTLIGNSVYLDSLVDVQQLGDLPLMRLIKNLPSGATYLDIGANIGLTAIAGAVARPDLRVVAFEPVPSNTDLLDRNVRANEIANCTVIHSALAEREGQLTMSDDGPWSVVDISGSGAVHAPVTTLDKYCNWHMGGRRIDLIKIDVEGYEPNVLAGARETITRWSPIIFRFPGGIYGRLMG